MVVHLHKPRGRIGLQNGIVCWRFCGQGSRRGRAVWEDRGHKSVDDAGCMEGVLIDWEKAPGRTGSVLESTGRRGYIEGTYREPGEGLCLCHMPMLVYFATGEYFHMPSWIQSSPGCVQPIVAWMILLHISLQWVGLYLGHTQVLKLVCWCGFRQAMTSHN